MNRARRAELNKIINTLRELRESIDVVRYDEETAMENMPESLQESERYDAMSEAVDAMSDAYDCIEEAIDRLEGAM